MNTKFLLVGIIIAIVVSIIVFQAFENENLQEENMFEETKEKLDIKSLFIIYGFEDNFEIKNDEKIWHYVEFGLNPENDEIYQQLRNDSEKTVVIFPIFTAAAYNEPGFYTYFRGECDEECLSIELKDAYPPTFASSGNGVQVLNLLGYKVISDIDVDQNPQILEEFDKIILLHNEYVTKKEFDAIMSHPNVVYLYPNALYAEVKVDYEKKIITLHKGHSYPDRSISNGFDWEFDNSRFEYNTDCSEMGFDRINNGWMLNCYPERAIHQSKVLLKMIKDF